jgi:hypothetical protein
MGEFEIKPQAELAEAKLTEVELAKTGFDKLNLRTSRLTLDRTSGQAAYKVALQCKENNQWQKH